MGTPARKVERSRDYFLRREKVTLRPGRNFISRNDCPLSRPSVRQMSGEHSRVARPRDAESRPSACNRNSSPAPSSDGWTYFVRCARKRVVIKSKAVVMGPRSICRARGHSPGIKEIPDDPSSHPPRAKTSSLNKPGENKNNEPNIYHHSVELGVTLFRIHLFPFVQSCTFINSFIIQAVPFFS